MQLLRRRLLGVMEDRNTLRDLMNELPADGDPNAVAISIAKASARGCVCACAYAGVGCGVCVRAPVECVSVCLSALHSCM